MFIEFKRPPLLKRRMLMLIQNSNVTSAKIEDFTLEDGTMSSILSVTTTLELDPTLKHYNDPEVSLLLDQIAEFMKKNSAIDSAEVSHGEVTAHIFPAHSGGSD